MWSRSSSRTASHLPKAGEPTRADELAYDPADGLILAINNASAPPFATMVKVDPASGAPSGAQAAAIVNGMRDRRVLISATGPVGHTLKIRPPLPFSRANADQLLEVLTDALAGLA